MISPKQLINSLPEDSWFREWDRAWSSVEMPTSFMLFTAMSIMGACLGRTVWYQDDFRPLLPMLNILLIGPSGIGKSSSMLLSRMALLEKIPVDYRPQFFGGATTKEKLHEDLLPMPLAILYASELGAFFNKAKYMEPLIPYVTELLDYGPIELRTKSGNLQRIPEPSVTVMGGSTKDWLQTALPDTAVGGGFLPRFLIIKEDCRRQRVANPSMNTSLTLQRETARIRENVWEGFLSAVLNHRGSISFADYSTADVYANWYNHHNPGSGLLSPFSARAPEFVKRLSMLIAISCKRNAIIEEDLSAGITLYSYTEQKLQEVVVPTNQIGKVLTSVLDCVPPQGASPQQIKRWMRTQATAQDVTKFLESLTQSGEIELREGRYYKLQENN